MFYHELCVELVLFCYELLFVKSLTVLQVTD